MRRIYRAAIGGMLTGTAVALFMMLFVDPGAAQGPPFKGEISMTVIGYGPGVYAVEGWYIPPTGWDHPPAMTISHQDVAMWQFAPPAPPVYTTGATSPAWGYRCYHNPTIYYWEPLLNEASEVYFQAMASWDEHGSAGNQWASAQTFTMDHYFDNTPAQSVGYFTAYPWAAAPCASVHIQTAPVRETITIGTYEHDPWTIHASGYLSEGDWITVQVKKSAQAGWENNLYVNEIAQVGTSWTYNKFFTTPQINNVSYSGGFKARVGKGSAAHGQTVVWADEVTVNVGGYAR